MSAIEKGAESSSLQPLTSEERSVLKQQARKSNFFVILVVGLATVDVLMTLLDKHNMDAMDLWVGVLLFAVLLVVVGKMRLKIVRDLRAGQKQILTGPLESKRENSPGYNSHYYVTLQKQEFEVSFEQWSAVEPNQWAEVHVAPKSRHVLRFVALNFPSATY